MNRFLDARFSSNVSGISSGDLAAAKPREISSAATEVFIILDMGFELRRGGKRKGEGEKERA